MNKPPAENGDSDRVRALLVDALDGQLSDGERQELNALLRSEQSARDDAARFLADDARLRAEAETIRRASAIVRHWRSDANDEASPDAKHGVARPSADSIFKRLTRQIDSHGLYVLAASLTLAVGAAWHYSTIRSELDRIQTIAAAPDPFSLPGVASEEDAGADRVVSHTARVTGVIDCDWTDPTAALAFGDRLEEGQRVSLE